MEFQYVLSLSGYWHLYILSSLPLLLLTKMNSLYQTHSKMLHSTKVIILVEKKRKEVAWLGFELTTSMLEVQCATHYTVDPS